MMADALPHLAVIGVLIVLILIVGKDDDFWGA